MTDITDFWTSTQGAALEPKRGFRFRVTLFDKIIWWAKDVTQPAASVSIATHDFMAHKFYYPGKVTWTDVSLTLVDPVLPGATTELFKALEDSGYIIPSSADDGFFSISKATATSNSGNVQIEVLDSEGNALHTWTLNNAFIMSITPSNLSYTDEELMTVAMTLKYDWATYADNSPENTVTDPLFSKTSTSPG